MKKKVIRCIHLENPFYPKFYHHQNKFRYMANISITYKVIEFYAMSWFFFSLIEDAVVEIFHLQYKSLSLLAADGLVACWLRASSVAIQLEQVRIVSVEYGSMEYINKIKNCSTWEKIENERNQL